LATLTVTPLAQLRFRPAPVDAGVTEASREIRARGAAIDARTDPLDLVASGFVRDA